MTKSEHVHSRVDSRQRWHENGAASCHRGVGRAEQGLVQAAYLQQGCCLLRVSATVFFGSGIFSPKRLNTE